jgi:hypothetical protein
MNYWLPSFSFFSWNQPKPLITRIEVKGPYVTLYGRKTIGEELHFVLKELKGVSINADNYAHGAIHGKRGISLLLSSDEHVHYKLATKDIRKDLTDLITAIFHRQNTPGLRETEYTTHVEGIERTRIERGDATVPQHVQKQLSQIDRTSPFFLSHDCQKLIRDILANHESYCNKPTFFRCRELIELYLTGIIKSGLQLDESRQQTLWELIMPLREMVQRLYEFEKDPFNLQLLHEIKSFSMTLKRDELVTYEDPDSNDIACDFPLAKRLLFLDHYIEEKMRFDRSLLGRVRINLFHLAQKVASIFFEPKKNDRVAFKT